MEGTGVNVVAPKAVKAEKAPKGKAVVGLDMSGKDVLQLDVDGYSLSFPVESGKLVELEEEEIRALSYENRVAYGVAHALSKELDRRKDQPKPTLESVKAPMAASATRRLEVIGIPDGWHYCWKRTDELHESSLSGYTMAGDEVKTFATRVGTTHRVSALGVDELVLMRIPQNMFDETEKANGEKSRSQIESQTNSAKEDIAKKGGIPFDPHEKDGRKWQEDVREEMTSA